MSVRVKTKKDMTKRMTATVKAMDGTKINVGVLSGENAWLAGIHEYGCTIPVTDRMRAYLHRIGVHLRKETTQIKIPERSFLRAGYDEKGRDAIQKAEKLLPDVLSGKIPEEMYFELVGTQLRETIKEYALNLKDPPKQEWPTRDPAKSNPLVMTGDMINGIEYEVEK